MPHVRWLIIGLVFLATVINYLNRLTISVLAPVITRELHLSNLEFAQVGVWFWSRTRSARRSRAGSTIASARNAASPHPSSCGPRPPSRPPPRRPSACSARAGSCWDLVKPATGRARRRSWPNGPRCANVRSRWPSSTAAQRRGPAHRRQLRLPRLDRRRRARLLGRLRPRRGPGAAHPPGRHVLLTEVSFGPGPVPPGAGHLDGPAVGALAARTGVGPRAPHPSPDGVRSGRDHRLGRGVVRGRGHAWWRPGDRVRSLSGPIPQGCRLPCGPVSAPPEAPDVMTPIRTQVRAAVERAWERAIAAGALPPLPDDEPAGRRGRAAGRSPSTATSPTNLAMKLARPYRRAPLEIADALAGGARPRRGRRRLGDARSPRPRSRRPGFLNLRLDRRARSRRPSTAILAEPDAWGRVAGRSGRAGQRRVRVGQPDRPAARSATPAGRSSATCCAASSRPAASA